MQWHPRIDPETNQIAVGFRIIITTVVAVMIIAFADDIKRAVIDTETSGLMQLNTRQNIEIIANSVTANERLLAFHSERILRLEIANKEHLKLQEQISTNTSLIRKVQNTQIRIVGKLKEVVSDSKALELRIRRIERE